MSELEIYEKDGATEKVKLYLTLRKSDEGDINVLLVDQFGSTQKILARFKGGKLKLMRAAKPSDEYDYGDLKFTSEGYLITTRLD